MIEVFQSGIGWGVRADAFCIETLKNIVSHICVLRDFVLDRYKCMEIERISIQSIVRTK